MRPPARLRRAPAHHPLRIQPVNPQPADVETRQVAVILLQGMGAKRPLDNAVVASAKARRLPLASELPPLPRPQRSKDASRPCSDQAIVQVDGKRPWTDAEDEALLDALQDGEWGGDDVFKPTGGWSAVARRLGSRNAKQCRERWSCRINPAINREPFTAEEDAQLAAGVAVFGRRWAKIAAEFATQRTPEQVKNRALCLDTVAKQLGCCLPPPTRPAKRAKAKQVQELMDAAPDWSAAAAHDKSECETGSWPTLAQLCGDAGLGELMTSLNEGLPVMLLAADPVDPLVERLWCYETLDPEDSQSAAPVVVAAALPAPVELEELLRTSYRRLLPSGVA
jgi:hypothetical protein